MIKPRALSPERFCRVAAPVLSAAFYASLALIAVMAAALPIIALANVTAGEMLLPPFISAAAENGVNGYSIRLGNGLAFFAAAGAVSAADIKFSVCLAVALRIVTLAAFAPACRFISKLCANVRDGKPAEPKNASYVIYAGLAVMIGEVAASFLTGYCNYRLVALFAADAGKISFAPGISVAGALAGALIILLGVIWSSVLKACDAQKEP